MLRSCSLLLALLICSTGCAAAKPLPDLPDVTTSSAEESAVREEIVGKVREAVRAEDFAALSALEEDFRSTRARTPSGVWKLAVFHAGVESVLDDGLSAAQGCRYVRAPFVAQWQTAAPKSPAPAIADAALLLRQAWCIRGDGFAASVKDSDRPRVRTLLAAANRRLDASEAFAASDPEFYAVKIDTLGTAGVGGDAIRAIVAEAVAREPDYHRTYFRTAWYLLPQWGGSFEEVEEFARDAAEDATSTEDSGLYARIFWSLDECGCDIVSEAADWQTMKRSMRDVYAHFPAEWNGTYFADLSCRMGDGSEGRSYLRALHPEATGDGDLALLFAGCDYQATRPT